MIVVILDPIKYCGGLELLVGRKQENKEYRVVMQAPVAGKRAEGIPDVYQFTPDHLMAEMARRGRLVGVVIDLTATEKYYDPGKAFKPRGITHIKLASKGHGEVPTPLVVNTFFWEVRKHMMMLQQQWLQVHSLPHMHLGTSLCTSTTQKDPERASA